MITRSQASVQGKMIRTFSCIFFSFGAVIELVIKHFPSIGVSYPSVQVVALLICITTRLERCVCVSWYDEIV